MAYGWRIIKRKLSQEEKDMGIIYKSQISQGEQIGAIRVVNKNDPDWKIRLKNLKNVKQLKMIAKANDYLVIEIIWT